MNKSFRLPSTSNKSPPILPGRVYQSKINKWVRAGILAISIGSYYYWYGYSEPFFWGLCTLFSLIIFFDVYKSSKTVYADLSSETISAKFENGKEIRRDSLSNYTLIISQNKRISMSKNYSYDVSLVSRGDLLSNGYSTKQDLIIITLAERILCPKNLREWVEGIQAQLKAPLPIFFSDDVVKSDYETGIFRSLK